MTPENTPAQVTEPLQIQPRAQFMTPRNLTEAMEFSKILSESDLVPKDYRMKPGNVLVAIQMGAEVGLSPMQAIQNIAVINGRPSMWGDAVLALVKGSGKLEYILEEDDGKKASCRVKRLGDPNEVISTFSMEDALRAGLSKKEGTWQTYPSRMRQMRARAFALRDAFPDVLKGLSVREEMEDTVKAKIEKQIRPAVKPPESPKEFIGPEERRKLFDLCEANRVSNDDLRKYLSALFGIMETSSIQKSDFSRICQWVQSQAPAKG